MKINRSKKQKRQLVDIKLDQNGRFTLLPMGFYIEEHKRPRIGQYIQLKKSIPGIKAEPKYNFKGHPEIPKGAWVKVIGHKMNRNYINIEYKSENGETYNTTPLLYPDDYHILPATDDTEVARILYDDRG